MRHQGSEDKQSKMAIAKLNENIGCNYQEDYSRRNNLQIIGIREQPGETWEKRAIQVSKILEGKLELPNIELERAHRVGQRFDDRNRPIIARFAMYCDHEAVVRNVSNLRGTRIYVNEDLCPASQNIRKAQIPLLKQARSLIVALSLVWMVLEHGALLLLVTQVVVILQSVLLEGSILLLVVVLGFVVQIHSGSPGRPQVDREGPRRLVRELNT